MEEIFIYSKDGKTQRCRVRKLEYSGAFMGESSVTVSVSSPVPITFAFGDYLTYRGEEYTINYDPSILKQARKSSYGEAYKYDNIKLNSYSTELTNVMFLDFVESDNEIHYSQLPTFSFYCENVSALVERIQVNLDRVYTGTKKWTVRLADNAVDTDGNQYEGGDDANISIDNQTVWDALALVNSEFDLNFIIRGRTITIGTVGTALSKVFKYGKDNGLITIQRTANSSEKVITRLRAYGSTRNMPLHYYRNNSCDWFIPKSVFGTVTTAWLDWSMADGSYYRAFNRTRLTTASISYDNSVAYYVDVTINSVVYHVKLYMYDSTGTGANTKYGISFDDYFDTSKKLISDWNAEEKGMHISVQYVNTTDWPIIGRNYAVVPNNYAVNNLMLPDFPNVTLDPYVDSDNIDALGVREGCKFFDTDDDEDGYEEIYPTISDMTIDNLKAAGYNVDYDYTDGVADYNGNLGEIVSAEQITDTGEYTDGTDNNLPTGASSTFAIYIKNIGFDINDYLTTEQASVKFNTGKLGGREFTISSVTKVEDKQQWKIILQRTSDDDLQLFFPNYYYNAAAGDEFVLLHIYMPDVYINAASQRLLTAAKTYLADHDYSLYTYELKVDPKVLQIQHDNHVALGEDSIHDTIKEGDLILFEDDDISVSGHIIIDKLTIKEGEQAIPQYDIVLRNEKTVGTIENIQNQIDSVTNGLSSGTLAAGLSASQVKALILAHGKEYFISKKEDDETAGSITSAKGFLTGKASVYTENNTGYAFADDITANTRILSDLLRSKSFSSGMLGSGYQMNMNNGVSSMEIDKLLVRMKAVFSELEIQKLSYSGGNYIFSSAAATLTKVETTDDGNYKCYFNTNDGETAVTNMFVVNDLVRCQSFNVKTGVYDNVSNKFYWRKVTSVGDDYIILSATDCATGSDIPAAEDEIVQLGNSSNTSRQNAIQISVYDPTGNGNAPAIIQYDGISTYSLDGKDVTTISPNGNKFVGSFTIKSSTGELNEITADGIKGSDGTSAYSYIKYGKGVTSKFENETTGNKNIKSLSVTANGVVRVVGNIKVAQIDEFGDGVCISLYSGTGMPHLLGSVHIGNYEHFEDGDIVPIDISFVLNGTESIYFIDEAGEGDYEDMVDDDSVILNDYILQSVDVEAICISSISDTSTSESNYMGTLATKSTSDESDYSKYQWTHIESASVSGITNKYKACASGTTPSESDTDWTDFATAKSSFGASKRVMWGIDITSYTDGKTFTSTPYIVSYYTEDGATIDDVFIYYQISSSSTESPTTWGKSGETFVPTSEKPYLWCEQATLMSDGNIITSTPYVINAKGEDGIVVTATPATQDLSIVPTLSADGLSVTGYSVDTSALQTVAVRIYEGSTDKTDTAAFVVASKTNCECSVSNDGMLTFSSVTYVDSNRKATATINVVFGDKTYPVVVTLNLIYVSYSSIFTHNEAFWKSMFTQTWTDSEGNPHDSISTIEQNASHISEKVNTDDLKECGIDIESDTITLAADKFKIKDVSGNNAMQIFTANSDGTVKISAEHLDLTGTLSANDNFYLDTDGNLQANNATISGAITATSGSFTGTINAAQGGNIGGFTVGTNQLTATANDFTMTVSPSLIHYRNSDSSRYVTISQNSATTAFSSLTCNMSIVNNKTNSTNPNVGLLINVSGSTSSLYNWSGNHALLIPQGNICGFRLQTHRISGTSYTPTIYDSILITLNSKTIITLPSDAEDGQMYYIFTMGKISCKITVDTSTDTKIYYTPDAAKGTSVSLSGTLSYMVVYNKTDDIWMMY